MSTFAKGTVVAGKYRLERPIGAGGMGAVYSAHNTQLDHAVAIKFLRPEYARDADVVGRFVREARIAVRIESPHIAKVHDFGVWESENTPYIVFELLTGQDLAQVLEAQGPLPHVVAVDHVMQALAGLAAAHVQGIAHRDLKPANLFLVAGPGHRQTIKVLDFGVAKPLKGRELGRGPQTKTAALLGTPLYMSPEQLRSSRRIDARADIWSVGVILYELLTGAPPFDGQTLGEFLTNIMQAVPVPLQDRRPDVPPALAAVVLKCLAKKRDDRFATVKELAEALAPFGSSAAADALESVHEVFEEQTALRVVSDPEMAAPPSDSSLALAQRADRSRPVVEVPRPSSRPPIALIVVGVTALLLVAGVVGFFLARR